MKNIHMLPTDKPSRLVKIKDNLFYTTTKNIPSGNYQNIYITSDEEIKYGDWVIKISSLYKGGGSIQKYSFIDRQFEDITFKKIILTTDPKLFNDGVQAIDDEFLEWFVNNPSCEKVELEVDLSKHNGQFQTKYDYKIIIPKETPVGSYFAKNADKIITITPKQHIEFINENIDEFDEQIIKFKEKQKEILIQMMKDDMKAGLYVDSEKRYTKDDLKRAHWNGWLMRERLDDMIPELDYPPGLDYEEKEEYTFNEFLKQLNNER